MQVRFIVIFLCGGFLCLNPTTVTSEQGYRYFQDFDHIQLQGRLELSYKEALAQQNYYAVLFSGSVPNLPLKIIRYVNFRKADEWVLNYSIRQRLLHIAYRGWDELDNRYSSKTYYITYTASDKIQSVTCRHADYLQPVGGMRLFYNELDRLIRVEYFDYADRITKSLRIDWGRSLDFINSFGEKTTWDYWRNIYPTANELVYFHFGIIQHGGVIGSVP